MWIFILILYSLIGFLIVGWCLEVMIGDDLPDMDEGTALILFGLALFVWPILLIAYVIAMFTSKGEK